MSRTAPQPIQTSRLHPTMCCETSTLSGSTNILRTRITQPYHYTHRSHIMAHLLYGQNKQASLQHTSIPIITHTSSTCIPQRLITTPPWNTTCYYHTTAAHHNRNRNSHRTTMVGKHQQPTYVNTNYQPQMHHIFNKLGSHAVCNATGNRGPLHSPRRGPRQLSGLVSQHKKLTCVGCASC